LPTYKGDQNKWVCKIDKINMKPFLAR
jgi:hypothetical protein